MRRVRMRRCLSLLECLLEMLEPGRLLQRARLGLTGLSKSYRGAAKQRRLKVGDISLWHLSSSGASMQ